MIDNILSAKELDFNNLEKEIFRIGCEFAAGLMVQILTGMYARLEDTRDKTKYRHKGTRCTTIKTLMGEVSYDRTVYETVLESGEKAHVYLLDEALNLGTFAVSYTHLRAHETRHDLVCRLLLEK